MGERRGSPSEAVPLAVQGVLYGAVYEDTGPFVSAAFKTDLEALAAGRPSAVALCSVSRGTPSREWVEN